MLFSQTQSQYTCANSSNCFVLGSSLGSISSFTASSFGFSQPCPNHPQLHLSRRNHRLLFALPSTQSQVRSSNHRRSGFRFHQHHQLLQDRLACRRPRQLLCNLNLQRHLARKRSEHILGNLKFDLQWHSARRRSAHFLNNLRLHCHSASRYRSKPGRVDLHLQMQQSNRRQSK